MASDSDNTPLDAGDWLPWRFFLHALSGVFTLRSLVLAAAGVYGAELATWVILELGDDNVLGRLALAPTSRVASPGPLPTPMQAAATALWGPLQVWQSVTHPIWAACGEGASAQERLTLAGVGLVRFGVWAFFGAALARVASRYMTLREPPTISRSLGHAARRRVAYVAPPLVLAVICGVLLIPLAAHAWLMGAPWLNTVAAITLPVAMFFALASAVVAVGIAIGWPLVWASLAAERPDPYDAVSSAYAYVTQGVVRLAVYLLVALLVAAPVGVLVELASAVTLHATTGVLGAAPEDAVGSYEAAWRIADFWVVLLLDGLPMIFYAAYFWFATVAVYLLLRRDIDGKQADELFEEDEPSPGDAGAQGVSPV